MNIKAKIKLGLAIITYGLLALVSIGVVGLIIYDQLKHFGVYYDS